MLQPSRHSSLACTCSNGRRVSTSGRHGLNRVHLFPQQHMISFYFIYEQHVGMYVQEVYPLASFSYSMFGMSIDMLATFSA